MENNSKEADLNLTDFDLFVKAADEIDRQRKVIKRVLGTINDLIGKELDKAFCSIEVPYIDQAQEIRCNLISLKIGKNVIRKKRFFIWFTLDPYKDDDKKWRIVDEYRNDISGDLPIPLSLALYRSLGDIVKIIDEKYPQLKIKEFFKTIIQFAPEQA